MSAVSSNVQASFWQRLTSWLKSPGTSTAIAAPVQRPDETSKTINLDAMPKELDDFTRARLATLIADVDDLTDTQNGIEQRVQNGYIGVIVIIIPIITAFILAYETGYFFAGRDFTWTSSLSWAQYGVSHILEAVLVALVFEMAKAKRNGNTKDWRWLFSFWLFFIATSYIGQFMYLLAMHTGAAIPIMGYVSIALRCASSSLVDLVSAGYLGKKPKTLEKQVGELEFKGHAIKTLTESLIQLNESIMSAVSRRKEEDARMERRRIEDEQVAKLRNMIMEAGLSAMTGVKDDNTRGW